MFIGFSYVYLKVVVCAGHIDALTHIFFNVLKYSLA